MHRRLSGKNKGEFQIKTSGNNHYVWVYFIAFFAVWCLRELWIVHYLDELASIPRAIISATIKIVIWIIPVILLIKYMEKSKPLTYLGLRQNFRLGFRWTAIVSLVLIIFFAVLNHVIYKSDIHFQLEFNVLLNTILLAGLTEEIVFRGFILRKLMDSYKFWVANIITALLFTSIHIPIWAYKGMFESYHILGSIISVLLLGLIFGLIYKKSRSLWTVIIIHSLYNFLVIIYN